MLKETSGYSSFKNDTYINEYNLFIVEASSTFAHAINYA